MTTRIFNILMGLWLFASAFVLPRRSGAVSLDRHLRRARGRLHGAHEL